MPREGLPTHTVVSSAGALLRCGCCEHCATHIPTPPSSPGTLPQYELYPNAPEPPGRLARTALLSAPPRWLLARRTASRHVVEPAVLGALEVAAEKEVVELPASLVPAEAACPLSTRGGTRLVRLVRGRGGGGYAAERAAPAPNRAPSGPDGMRRTERASARGTARRVVRCRASGRSAAAPHAGRMPPRARGSAARDTLGAHREQHARRTARNCCRPRRQRVPHECRVGPPVPRPPRELAGRSGSHSPRSSPHRHAGRLP